MDWVGGWGRKVVLGLIASGLAVCLYSSRAGAQEKMQIVGGYSYGTFSSSYECGFGCGVGFQGYAAGFSYSLAPHLALEGSFTGHNGTATIDSEQATSNQEGQNFTSKEALYVYTFGPRLSLPIGNFTLFTHFLAGASHESSHFSDTCTPPTGGGGCFSNELYQYSGSGFAFRTGAGVDWNHGAWGIRILELDYVRSQIPITVNGTQGGTAIGTQQFSSTNSGAEIVTGVTINLGKARP